MATRFRKLLARSGTLVVGGLMLLGPSVALAQDTVPQPDLNRSPPIWLGYLVMVVLVAAVMAVSLLPSKRGHQD